MLLPLLTDADPIAGGEGSIDPLGMYPIADALAVRLAPGVRERQSHPRFLTATAVSLAVCSAFDDDEVAADGKSEPWQVFEWYAVEGLVRKIADRQALRGLPGREKAASAIEDGVPLCADRYLKTPSVFGFHGVYRVLARDIRVEIADRLGEAGYDILQTWAREQGLQGFYDSTGGPGAEWRSRLADAVRDGLKSGCVARTAQWKGWDFFADHLGQYDAGPRERKALWQALLDSDSGYRRPVLQFLVSEEGRRAVGNTPSNGRLSEKAFHEALARQCDDASLRELLRVISTYEQFARLLQDAYDDCLYAMSLSKTRVPVTALKDYASVRRASEEIPPLFEKLTEILEPFGQSLRFHEVFADVSNHVPPADWVADLLEYHRRVQRQKPPDGKAPWFERFDDGTYMIRPAYARRDGGLHNNEYVHYYRTEPLLSFARDLGMAQ